mgnify:CR=1 FL=1
MNKSYKKEAKYMEIYDTANKLAEELKNSKQYKDLKGAKEKLMQDENKKASIVEFEKLKQEVQLMELKRSQSKPIDEEEKKQKKEALKRAS